MTNELITKDASFLSEEKFEHAYRMANMIASTQLIPKQFQGKPADVLVAFEFGRSLGLGMLQAVQNIAVVNGRPCLYGDAVLAVCQSHPEFEYIKELEIKDEKGVLTGFECTVKRRSFPDETVRTFTIDDAKKASLWGKTGPWSQYSSRMLQLRARSFALRDVFADSLSGVRVAEEVQDYQEIDVTPKTKRQEKNQKAENIIKDISS
jgi:hypothetical protein